MNQRTEMYQEVVDRVTGQQGFEVVELRIPTSRRILLTVDRQPTGVDVDSLSQLHRELIGGLHEAGFAPELIHVEVQSPGLDRKLLRDKDFVRFTGQEVRAVLNQKWEGRVRFTGELLGLGPDGRTMRIRDRQAGEVEVDRTRLKEVRLVPQITMGRDPEP